MEEAAQILEDRNQRGLFLLTVQELAAQENLLRRLIGAGHLVGLRVVDDLPADAMAQVEEGRRLLAEIALCRLIIVSLPQSQEEFAPRLEELGYALWRAGIAAGPDMEKEELLSALDGEGPNFVEFECGTAQLALLDQAMDDLAGSGYRLRLATAPML